MHPTSEAQAAAYASGTIPLPETVRDGLFAVPITLGHKWVPYAFSYAIEDDAGAIHLVDAGGLTADSLAELEAGLASVGHTLEQVASVTATHLHPDHLGLAELIRARTGARVGLHRIEQGSLSAAPADPTALIEEWEVPADRRAELMDRPSPIEPLTADVLLEDDDRLDIPGRDVRVVHVPGHTAGSVSLVDAGERILFTGDHLLPDQFPGIGIDAHIDGNPVRDYLHSLDRVLEFGDHEVLPGHGWRFEGLADRVAVTRAHHGRRTTEVAAVLAEHPDLSVWELASRITWTAGWENLRSFYTRSALMQTAWHRDIVIAGV